MSSWDHRRKVLAGTCLLFLGLFLAACSPEAASQAAPTTTSSPTPSAASATGTPVPSSTPTPREMADSLGTLRAELTAEPCTIQEVLTYSNQALPLADEHLKAARLAQSMQPWQEGQEGVDRAYREATARLQTLKDITPPPCADLADLKFTSAFELLVDVWDHLGEGEFDLAQRKLLSSFEEMSQAAELLSALQQRIEN